MPREVTAGFRGRIRYATPSAERKKRHQLQDVARNRYNRLRGVQSVRRGLSGLRSVRDAGELPQSSFRIRSQPVVAAAAVEELPDGARSCRSRELPSRRRTPWRQNSARCTSGRSDAVAVRSAPRAEEWESCGTSTTGRHAAGMMALHNVVRWEFALPPHQPRVYQSTYTWARLDPEIGQSNSRAAIIAPCPMQWEALFHIFVENFH